jgi:hypothetical protein
MKIVENKFGTNNYRVTTEQAAFTAGVATIQVI